MNGEASRDKGHAPAAKRNREQIADVLTGCLPDAGLVLEIASGTGEHVIWFAERFPRLTWQPSDPDPAARASIAAWARETDLPNVREPVELDVRAPQWSVESAAAIVCINMIHISPWAATEGLFAGAARLLSRGSVLYTYGPYMRNGIHTAPSNAAFDESLKARNPDWGVRDIADVANAAEVNGFDHEATVTMPANNFSLIYRRR